MKPAMRCNLNLMLIMQIYIILLESIYTTMNVNYWMYENSLLNLEKKCRNHNDIHYDKSKDMMLVIQMEYTLKKKKIKLKKYHKHDYYS